MVRSVADRAFLPTKNLLEEVGDMMILTGKTIVSALRPPYPYGGEFVSQFLFALLLCWFPLLISTVAFGYEAPGLQAADFLVLFGALDRLGGFFVLASIREFAPFVTAVVLAGVAGTAITADLGARKIREELDALQGVGAVWEGGGVGGGGGEGDKGELGGREDRGGVEWVAGFGVGSVNEFGVAGFLGLEAVEGPFDFLWLFVRVFRGVLATVVNHAP